MAVTATVGDLSVPAHFSATGLYQREDLINIGPLPASLAGKGEVPVVLTFDNKPANVVTVNIQ